MNEPCTSYQRGGLVCRDGFVQTVACSGYVCVSCGAAPKIVPYCLRDEIPEHMLTDDGKPLFYRAFPSDNSTEIG